MKILLDDGLQKDIGTGIGNYAAALGEALSALPNTDVTREDFAASGSRAKARAAYLAYLGSRAYREKLGGFDVVHYANYAMPQKLPTATVAAVTVHDLTAFTHPETLPRAYAAYNRFMIRRAVKRADLILTVSESMKQELVARFPMTAQRVAAVYPAHDAAAIALTTPPVYENKALLGLEKRKFFLFVGTIERRKNLTDLVRAYLLLQKTCPAARGYALVLAGREGFGADELKKLIENLPEGAEIRLPGYISADDRRKLYGEAAAFVFPSLYEGFGSPQTEAMAAGLPLILSDIPTNREVSGNYGYFYPLGDESALAALMARAVAGKLQADSALAAARLLRFSREALAARTKDAYLAAMKRKQQ